MGMRAVLGARARAAGRAAVKDDEAEDGAAAAAVAVGWATDGAGVGAAGWAAANPVPATTDDTRSLLPQLVQNLTDSASCAWHAMQRCDMADGWTDGMDGVRRE